MSKTVVPYSTRTKLLYASRKGVSNLVRNNGRSLSAVTYNQNWHTMWDEVALVAHEVLKEVNDDKRNESTR